MMISRYKSICLLACLAFHTYVHYMMAENKRLAELLRPKELAISAHSVFFGHEYRQCGVGVWLDSNSLYCHTCLIPWRQNLKDAVVFVQESNLAVVQIYLQQV